MKKIMVLLMTAALAMGLSFAPAEDGILKLPDNLMTVGAEAFANSKITEVSIGANVTEIGAGAFKDCSELQTISFRNSSSLEKIGEDAFAGDFKLSEVNFESDVTYIGSRAFQNCSNLKIVRFSNPNVQIEQDTFSGCASDFMIIITEKGSVQQYAEEYGFDCRVSKNRAVLIGIDYTNWKDTLHSKECLSGCYQDAIYMYLMLDQMKGTSFVTYMVDENATEEDFRKAIKDNFMSSLTGTPDDVSLLYFSGHGNKSYGNYNLVCSNYYDGDYSADNNGRVSATELKKLLDKIPGKKIVIIDACYSGSLIGKGEDDSPEDFTQNFISSFMDDEFTSRDGELATNDYFVITACGKNEQSFTIATTDEDTWYGAMTYWLMKGSGYNRLGEYEGVPDCKFSKAEADSNNDGKLVLSELASYIQHNVKKRLKALK